MIANLNDEERRFLARQLRNERWYLYFSGVGILVALIFTVLSLWRGNFDGRSFAIIILILLMARANLKQHKDARLLRKLTGGPASAGE